VVECKARDLEERVLELECECKRRPTCWKYAYRFSGVLAKLFLFSAYKMIAIYAHERMKGERLP
jgi:hypothetical protein